MIINKKNLFALCLSSILLVCGCGSSKAPSQTTVEQSQEVLNDPNVKTVMQHNFFVDSDIMLETVINKYVVSPIWDIEKHDSYDTVTVEGFVRNVNKRLFISFMIQDDPEDENMSIIDVTEIHFGHLVDNTDGAWLYLSDFYDYYNAGKEDLTELDRLYMSSFQNWLTDGFEWIEIPNIELSGNTKVLQGSIRNIDHAPTYATIKINLMDENNNVIGVTSAEIAQIKQGEIWKFSAPIPANITNLSSWDILRFGTSQYDASDFTKVDIGVMLEELENNALRAETKYQDMLVEITGYVDTIDSDGSYFTLKASDDIWSFKYVQCYLKNDAQRQKLMSINSGDRITVWAKITTIGEILGYGADVIEIK